MEVGAEPRIQQLIERGEKAGCLDLSEVAELSQALERKLPSSSSTNA